MTTQTMIERMASAIWRARQEPGDFADATTQQREWLFDEVRAALQALREPTNHMIEVGDQVVLRHFTTHTHSDEELTYRTACPAPEYIWSYMLDAALQEKT